MADKIKYCPKCIGNGYKKNECMNMTLNTYIIYNGFYDTFWLKDKTHCEQCNTELIPLTIIDEEWRIIQKTSADPDFIFALDKLKQEDIIEYNLKLSQFKQTSESIQQTEIMKQQSKSDTTPKCPTCGSTNIKKISATKRWVSTGILGLGSSDLGKTMCCESCGAKW